MTLEKIMDAADHAIAQLKKTAAVVLQCAPDDLDVGVGRFYLKPDLTFV